MDLNRIKKNLLNRNWSSKSNQTNVNYIKGKLKQFNLSIPKYLTKNNKLTNNQIEYHSKRIINAIEKTQDHERKHGLNITMEKALRRLEKATIKHNNKVAKQMYWVQNEYNLSDKEVNYLMGYQVEISDYWNKNTKDWIEYVDSPFEVLSTDNLYFSDTNAVNERIKQIENKTNQLKRDNIRKFLNNNKPVLSELKSVLMDYSNDGNMLESESKLLLNEIKKLNGIQQKAFFTIWRNSAPKTKYIINEDEKEDFQYNLKNKWDRILKMVQKI